MGLLLLGTGTYVGIIACVWMVSTAFEAGGIFGVLGLIALCIIGLLIASATYDDGKKR